MCGIVYLWRKDGKPASKQLLKRYERQADRGTEGFGYVSLNDKQVIDEYQRFMHEEQVYKALRASESSHVLFHHRWPTSTVNVPESAHPILVKHPELEYSYYVVHNGVISNSGELRDKHLALGYKYTTELETQYKTMSKKVFYGATEFNDSESLAIELARTIEGKQVMVMARGAIAVIIFKANKAGTRILGMYYGTNGGNPLTIEDTPTGLCIASEGGQAITANEMNYVDFETGETRLVDCQLIAHATYTYPTYAKPYDYNWHKDEEDEFVPKDDERDYSYDEVTDLRHEYQDLKADLEIARSSGDSDEIENLEYECSILMDEITNLETKSRIGF